MGMAAAVVLAAGLGTRVGADGNKAYLPLSGRSMLIWSLEALTRTPGIGRIVLVFRRGEFELASGCVERELAGTAVELVEGGNTRHASESNVLHYLAADIESGAVDVVAIHDAARPLAGPDMFSSAVALAREFGGALPALPVTTLVRVGAAGPEPVDQHGSLVRVQTPQAFRAAELLEAYRRAGAAGFEGTDTSSCIEKYSDVEVRTFPGSTANLKVTYARDIALAQRLLSEREGLRRPR